jgi:hypothetical protein
MYSEPVSKPPRIPDFCDCLVNCVINYTGVRLELNPPSQGALFSTMGAIYIDLKF